MTEVRIELAWHDFDDPDAATNKQITRLFGLYHTNKMENPFPSVNQAKRSLTVYTAGLALDALEKGFAVTFFIHPSEKQLSNLKAFLIQGPFNLRKAAEQIGINPKILSDFVNKTYKTRTGVRRTGLGDFTEHTFAYFIRYGYNPEICYEKFHRN